MLSKVQKWGNSQGLRFTKAILQEAQINVGDEVNISVQKGRIIIEPVTKVRGRYDLKELVSKMPQGHQAEELDWGEAMGKEVVSSGIISSLVVDGGTPLFMGF